jgi:hypothetical protein
VIDIQGNMYGNFVTGLVFEDFRFTNVLRR